MNGINEQLGELIDFNEWVHKIGKSCNSCKHACPYDDGKGHESCTYYFLGDLRPPKERLRRQQLNHPECEDCGIFFKNWEAMQ